MKNKNEFDQVGQVVMGDSKQEKTLQNHNVMNVNIAKESDEIPILTKLQRNKITAKVNQIMASSGRTYLEVYGDLLTEFGAPNMDSFPREKYKDAHNYLDSMMQRSKAHPQQDSDPASRSNRGGYTDQAQPQTKNRSFFIFIILAILGGLQLWSFVKHSHSQEQEVTAKVDDTCQYDGKNFSINSLIKMPDNTFWLCSSSKGSASSVWVKSEPTKKTLPKPQRKAEPEDW